MPTGKNDNPNNSTRYNPKGWKSTGAQGTVNFPPKKPPVLQTVNPPANASTIPQLQTVMPNGPASSITPLQTFTPRNAVPQLQTALPNAPHSGIQPDEMTNDYVGEPVNESYSDTLRSMEPVQLGSGDVNTSYSDMLRSMAAGGNYPNAAARPSAPPQTSGYGGWSFGTRYKGWGNGGGGNYGGGGDYGGNPWINYMLGLNNWQI